MLRTRVSSSVAGVFFLSAGAIAEEEIRNWTAPPFWAPPEALALEKMKEEGTLETMGADAVPTGPLPFFGITPCRLVDTTKAEFGVTYGPPALIANTPRSFDLNNAPTCPGIPANAEAYSLNVTAAGTQGPGFIVIYPQGGALPVASTLNYVGGQTIANAAIVPAGTGGGVTVIAGTSGTHLIIDINGYYAPISIVNTLNGLSGAVTLAGSSTVTVTPAGNTLTLNATGGLGGLLPGGSDDQTLRHNGSAWVVAPNLFNDGSTVEIFGDLELSGNLILPDPLFIGAGANSFLHNVSDGVGANTYLGMSAGVQPTPGNSNTGVGRSALFAARLGSSNNVALGAFALSKVTTGTGNIAIGSGAGIGIIPGINIALSSGSNNIYIGNAGSGDESGQIRIGTNGVHTQGTVIASIHGFGSGGGIPVIVNAGGRLGTTTSSVRYKQDVRNVGGASDGLMSLRPVAFKYKESHEAGGLTQYGLIAEEVAEVYPELVVYDDEGRPQAIRSQLLDPLLLNEIQKQRREIQDLKARLEELERKSAP